MIGLFKISDKRDGSTFCIAESLASEGVSGRFFIPPLFRDAVSELRVRDTVFCVLDDSSGYGAILYKVEDGITDENTMRFSHSIDVKGDINAHGSVDVGVDLNVTGNIKGNAPNSTINLTPAHSALILASALSGTAAPLASVPVILDKYGV